MLKLELKLWHLLYKSLLRYSLWVNGILWWCQVNESIFWPLIWLWSCCNHSLVEWIWGFLLEWACKSALVCILLKHKPRYCLICRLDKSWIWILKWREPWTRFILRVPLWSKLTTTLLLAKCVIQVISLTCRTLICHHTHLHRTSWLYFLSSCLFFK